MAANHSNKGKHLFTRRRVLLGTVALVGGGLGLRWLTSKQPSLASGPDVLEPNAFLQITPDGQFIFQLDRVEMGQGTMTGLATLVAEELDLDPARLTVRFAPVLSTFKRPLQLTGQSLSLVDSWEILRETGAAARSMLVEAAARRWQVDAARLRTDDGLVIDDTENRSLAYQDLAEAAAQLLPPWRLKLKARPDWRWIGTEVPRLDTPLKVTGQAIYGMDVQLGDMLTAVIARCPELGGRLTSFDADTARGMPGVAGIVELANGVAAVANDFWSAKAAAGQITIECSAGPLREQSDQTILAEQLALLDTDEPDYQYFHGEKDVAPQTQEVALDADYTTPYLAHATMEPMNATVHYREIDAEVWVPTQWPDYARQAACDALGLSREQVTVHTTWIGGGFGRRVLADFVTEAALIAKEFAVPVKLVWTREHDMQHAVYRQQTAHRLRGRLDSQGQVVWWGHRQVLSGTGDRLTPPTISTLLSEKISGRRRADFSNWMGEKIIDLLGAFQAQEGAKELIYAIPDRSLEQVNHQTAMPISIWRSVANSYNGFVVESFIDELAHAADRDPLEYRREYLKDEPDVLSLLDRLKTLSGWGSSPSGRYQGVAVFRSFGTVVGQVAEVSIAESKTIRVHRVCCAVDCGTAVSPDIVRAQMESGIIFGLTAALYGEINMQAGKIVQSNFHDYRMLRMADAPNIDVHIMPSEREPSGVGEPGTPPIAAAVANAVFAATGQRLRSLPLSL